MKSTRENLSWEHHYFCANFTMFFVMYIILSPAASIVMVVEQIHHMKPLIVATGVSAVIGTWAGPLLCMRQQKQTTRYPDDARGMPKALLRGAIIAHIALLLIYFTSLRQ